MFKRNLSTVFYTVTSSRIMACLHSHLINVFQPVMVLLVYLRSSINKLCVRITVRLTGIPIIYLFVSFRSIPIGTSLRKNPTGERLSPCKKPVEIHLLIFFSPFVHTSSLVFHFFITVSLNLQMSSGTPIHRYTFNIQL